MILHHFIMSRMAFFTQGGEENPLKSCLSVSTQVKGGSRHSWGGGWMCLSERGGPGGGCTRLGPVRAQCLHSGVDSSNIYTAAGALLPWLAGPHQLQSESAVQNMWREERRCAFPGRQCIILSV